MALLSRSILAAVAMITAAFTGLGCATGSDEVGGGGLNLPSSLPGVLTVDENPLVLGVDGETLAHPSVERATETRLTVWVGVESDASAHVARIIGERAEDGVWSFERAANPALTATHGWEKGQVSQPSVIRIGEEYRMAYIGGGGDGIGIATSDDGATFVGADSPALTPAATWEAAHLGHPSLLSTGDRLLVFWLGGEGAGLGVAESYDAGATFSRLADEPVFGPAPVPEPPADPEATPEKPPFDAVPLTGARVVETRTPLDRTVLQLWYSAGDRLALAASFDGLAWSRSDANPLLEDLDFDIASPSPAGDLLLHIRNIKKKKPKLGRGLGLARFQ